MGKKGTRSLGHLRVATREATRDVPLNGAKRAFRAHSWRAKLRLLPEGGSSAGEKLAGEDDPLIDNEGDEGKEGDVEGLDP